jgi:hypothetical protein
MGVVPFHDGSGKSGRSPARHAHERLELSAACSFDAILEKMGAYEFAMIWICQSSGFQAIRRH